MDLAIGLVALATALAGLFAVIRNGQATRAKVAEVHVLVNSRLDEALKRVSQLEENIAARGQTVPPAP